MMKFLTSLSIACVIGMALSVTPSMAQKRAAKRGPTSNRSVMQKEDRISAQAAALRYKWFVPKEKDLKSKGNHGISIKEVLVDGKREVNINIPSQTEVEVLPGPSGEMDNIAIPGSRDLHILIDERAGSTDCAGLTFRTPCTLGILADGTVMTQQSGVRATSADGKHWVSRSASIRGKEFYIFVSDDAETSSPMEAMTNARSMERAGELYKAPLPKCSCTPSDGIVIKDVMNGGKRIQVFSCADNGVGKIGIPVDNKAGIADLAANPGASLKVVTEEEAISGIYCIPHAPGSHNVYIAIDPEVGSTVFAGLTFKTPCLVERVEKDGTLVIDREKLSVKDSNGTTWISRKVRLKDRDVVAFVRQ